MVVFLQVDSQSGAIIQQDENATAGRVVQGSQANNCYVFPGISLGAVAAGAADVTEGMLLAAARALAGARNRPDTRAHTARHKH